MNTTRAAALLIASIGVWAAGCSPTATERAPVTVSSVTVPPSAPPSAPPAGRPAHPTPGPASPGAADGSTGNDLSPEYCAQNQDPGCPAGSFVGPDAIPNPNGDDSYVPCEGTICTNPNHGAGPGDDDAAAECEGTVCTNPNHGAGSDQDDTADDIPEPGQDMQSP